MVLNFEMRTWGLRAGHDLPEAPARAYPDRAQLQVHSRPAMAPISEFPGPAGLAPLMVPGEPRARGLRV